MTGIYIHIPFCKQACSYCDFYFLTRQQLRQPFVDALVREILSYKDSEFSLEPVRTIYFGGGTPSLLNESQLVQIFSALDRIFDLQPVEVTMELNPDDVTAEYLDMICSAGVNRASMGVQSFQEELLRFMHRAHSPGEAVRALEALRKANFDTFTADLIYGNPGQTTAMLKEDIRQLLRFNPPHISAYSLTVETNTRFGKQVEAGRITPADDEEVSVHFDLVRSEFADAGLEQYEVSNYSKPDKEAVHNSSYWNHQNYIGLGPSAHSFWWGKEGAVRWRNKPDLKFYLEHGKDEYEEEKELLSLQTLAGERLILGLRTKWGVSVKNLREKYRFSLSEGQAEWIKKQERQGTINAADDQIKLTPEGLKIADLLTVELLSRA